MKPELPIAPARTTAAANQDRFAAPAAGGREPAAGWDPYEVWRTRVRKAGGYGPAAAGWGDARR